MRYRLAAPFVVGALVLMVVTACQRPRTPRCCPPAAPQATFVDPGAPVIQDVTPAQPMPQATIDTGALYATSCAKCHGDKGQGSEGAPMLIGPGALAKAPSVDGLAQYIQKEMPPEGHGNRLTAAQALALAEFAWKANGKQ